MKTKNLILILSLIAIIFIVGCGQTETIKETQEPYEEPQYTDDTSNIADEPREDPTEVDEPVKIKDNFVVITDNGYEPETMTIKVGETVLFINEGTRKNWPASDLHPTHTLYPGSNKQKCGTESESTIFDACKGLESTESYSFTFNEKGTWTYHDHLRPSLTGTIIVE